MCGVVGAFGPRLRDLALSLDAAIDVLRHRGPDDQGHYHCPRGCCQLGHTRLSILDLSDAAHQPMVSEGGVIAYNGEIYNHLVLRRIRLAEHTFRSTSDTETLLTGLDRYGMPFLRHAQGMYAGAYYAPHDRRLFLFRDPLGIKPLYTARLPDSTVVFASEIKALTTLARQLHLGVDARSLATYLCYENVPPGHTLFDNVQLLQPGELVELSLGSGGRVAIHRSAIAQSNDHRADEKVTSVRSTASWVSHLRQQLHDAVTQHLLSDRPLAVYMSGGIDSTLVAALARRQGRDLEAFTGYFHGEEHNYYDERALARRVAHQCGIKEHHEVCIGPDDFVECFDRLIRALDSPQMGMGAFSQYVVARRVAQSRRVILSGHGGDELFAGYPLFKALHLLKPSTPARQKLRILSRFTAKEWPWALVAAYSHFVHGAHSFAPQLMRRSRLAMAPSHDSFRALRRTQESGLDALARYYRRVYLPGLLVVEDKISMAHSLETRTPLWSTTLVDFAATIPIEQKMGPNAELKGLLRQVVAGMLPAEVLSAPKRGFPTPLRNWFRGPLLPLIRERLLNSGDRLDPILNRPQRERIINFHRKLPLPFALDERRAHQIWLLLSLESWSRQFSVDLSPLGHTRSPENHAELSPIGLHP